jgi:hypothetical protein
MTTSKRMQVIEVTARLRAAGQGVYDTIADYKRGHPRILPRQFSGLTVERGGVGAGTVIRFNTTFLGRTTTSRAEITEPQPGRVLVETIAEANLVTTFIVEPGGSPAESVVTIRTEMPVRRGIAGAIERFLTTRLLRPVYVQELRLLEEVAAGPPQREASATSRA